MHPFHVVTIHLKTFHHATERNHNQKDDGRPGPRVPALHLGLLTFSTRGWGLGELEAFELDVGGAEVGEVVVGLLSAPGFGAAAEYFGEADDHFGRDAPLPVDKFRESDASDTEDGSGFGDGQAERFDF